MADDLKENQLALTDFSNTAFSGTVTVDDPSEYLLVTVPYAEGWHAKVNGQSVETISLLNGGFMGVQFPEAGEYEVSFYYIPQGFILGLIITITTGIVLVGIYYFYKKKNKTT